MRVMVTGAAGFIGARLVEVLLEGGYRVLGMDRFDRQEAEACGRARLAASLEHKHFGLVEADVRDAEGLDEAMAAFRPQVVINLATRRDLVWAESLPTACFRLHLSGAARVMAACERAKVDHLVLGSSAHVYGGSRRLPFREDDPADRPLSMLGASFRAMELAAHAFSLRSPVNISLVRFFSVYGPRQARDRFVPTLLAAADRRAAMPLFGDGTAARDMIYVDDAVVGLLRVLDRPAPFRILNLGSAQTTTLAQVADRISAQADVMLRLERFGVRPGEMPNTWADMACLRDEFGFEPSIELHDGLRRTALWWAERGEAFRKK